MEDVLFNRRPDATDRLVSTRRRLETRTRHKTIDLSWREAPVEERLRYALVKGIGDYVVEDVEEARQAYELSLSIIEGPLMDGMNIVGDLFGVGQDVPAAGGEERARDEEGGGPSRALYRG